MDEFEVTYWNRDGARRAMVVAAPNGYVAEDKVQSYPEVMQVTGVRRLTADSVT